MYVYDNPLKSKLSYCFQTYVHIRRKDGGQALCRECSPFNDQIVLPESLKAEVRVDVVEGYYLSSHTSFLTAASGVLNGIDECECMSRLR